MKLLVILYLGGLVFVFKSFQITMVSASSFGLTLGQLLSCTSRCLQALEL